MEHSLIIDSIWHLRQMTQKCWIFLLFIVFCVVIVAENTVSDEAAALKAVADGFQNKPGSWNGFDPCGSVWLGIKCTNYHITSIILPSVGVTGTLAGDIGNLPELLFLDLSYNPDLGGSLPASIGKLHKLKNLILLGCGFSGQIPPELGNLQHLTILDLNYNKLSGPIPPSLGNLSSLYWFDITENEISGTIPISDGINPGLDMLRRTEHFHFGGNKLSGNIPPELFHSGMVMEHLICNNNNFTGSIPSTLNLVPSLEALRLDGNKLTGPVPTTINSLTSMKELYLSNNLLTGPLPNLTGMNALDYVDLSNNSFDVSDVPPWFSSLPSLTTLLLEHSQVQGGIPAGLFSFSPLQTVQLKNNLLNGTLEIDSGYSTQLRLVDLQTNDIADFRNNGNYNKTIILADNPVCRHGSNENYCAARTKNNSPYSTPNSCSGIDCPSEQALSPNCFCSYPYEGILYFRLLTVSNFQNSTYYQDLEKKILSTLQVRKVPVDSVAVHDPFMDASNYLEISVEVFPSGKAKFDQGDIVLIASFFSNQTSDIFDYFTLYNFIPKPYIPILEGSSSKSSNTAAIVGASAGGVVALLVIIGLVIFVMIRKKGKAKKMEQSYPFGSWDPSKRSGSVPQLKGARCFSFEELKKCTDNFSEPNHIGSGGYGKVYKGTLLDGQMVAVKRAQEDSMQGGHEFKNEIELLTRVHHRNLVNLVGFCFDQGEQMLVYEYLPNGTLRESLSGMSGIRLDWKKRLWIALDAARGLSYLHFLADPPIVHRDIKSNNILLDNHLHAKVADFGLSKPMTNDRKGHVTTQVKGTMGYLDPEYYMTQQLTEKSDVYSFGVLLLELITARKPIERNKYIVREVKSAIDKKTELYGLEQLVDSTIGLSNTLAGFNRFVDLALMCVGESGADRPTMSEVVKEIENIMQLAGINPNAESASTSASYGDSSFTLRGHLYSNEALMNYSGAIPSSRSDTK
ncbi:probable leucine-rich repeat receptor-like protein kinase At5g49770 [Dioscorea cayenensis subsp. rotundata]|uniref:non-specific serine/threonine protein kinase n=1 Tax=Dioscorea cayennensis subsp. rotundata TaxID=55577 RepID=A0AB40C0T3_DIOCR|nr:probable leucine-rich repeat receptor-like protein kinase At5g49770 [Dioscorea cayenensis subsp. rotundata]